MYICMNIDFSLFIDSLFVTKLFHFSFISILSGYYFRNIQDNYAEVEKIIKTENFIYYSYHYLLKLFLLISIPRSVM